MQSLEKLMKFHPFCDLSKNETLKNNEKPQRECARSHQSSTRRPTVARGC